MNDLAFNLSLQTDWALLVGRFVMAAVMLYYGWPKLKNLKKNADGFVKMGFRPGWLWGTLVALLETVGSALLILGLWVPLIGLLFMIQMAVGAIWKITRTDKPFTDWSYDLLILALAFFLAVSGGGAYTLSQIL